MFQNKTKLIGKSSEMNHPDAEWVKLTSYGEFKHTKGLQKVTHSSANEIVRFYRSLRGKIGRSFAPLPIFIGHPDDRDFRNVPGHADNNIYGEIVNLKVEDSGLWAQVLWTNVGKRIVREKLYRYLSPRWTMRAIHPDVFEPIRLLSVGLTNRPNIPGQALPNVDLPSVPKCIKKKAVSEGLVFANTTRSAGKKQFVRLVHERMSITGESYVSSWNALKQIKPELYCQF